jgi:hypothetical protein
LPAPCLWSCGTYTFGTCLGATTVPTSRIGSFGSGRLRENFLPSQRTRLCFWGGHVLPALRASRKFSHRVDAASLGGLCCMVVAGPRTVCVVMGSDDCALCAQEVEALDHLLLGCVHNRETWFRIMHYYGMQHLTSQRGAAIFRVVAGHSETGSQTSA